MFKKKNPNEMLDRVGSAFSGQLGENLYSCVAYGSAVRGDYVAGTSDINLMLVLRESTPQAHQVIKKVIVTHAPIDPFIVGLKGLERSMKVFALKFASIQRDYKIIHGEDPFNSFEMTTDLDKFLCEQSIRNLRLRIVHTYVVRGEEKKWYSRHLEKIITPLMVDLSEVARIQGQDVPHDFADRLGVLGKTFNLDMAVVSDLLSLKNKSRVLNSSEILGYHSKLFFLLNHVVFWIEKNWQLPVPGGAN